jgi:hypothetical protein
VDGTMRGAAPGELGGFSWCRAALSGTLFFLISKQISTLCPPRFSAPRACNYLFHFAQQIVTGAQLQQQRQQQLQKQLQRQPQMHLPGDCPRQVPTDDLTKNKIISCFDE